jgi:Arc/MetJ-type ribon-helix-helix transcriptional regulator
MTRKPVTVTEDQMRLIEGATAIGLYSSRSAVVRNAFREYFADNEVLLAVLLANMDDVDVYKVVSSIGADTDFVFNILDSLGESVERAETESILDEIEEDFQPSGTNDSI